MKSVFIAHLLLAQRNVEKFRNMGGGFRQKQENFNPAELLLWIAIPVVAFVALNLLSRLLSRSGKRRLYNSPRALFRSLCRAHSLSGSERRTLRQLAAQHGLTYPAQIFLRPDCFDGTSAGQGQRGNAAHLAALSSKLFGPSPFSSRNKVEQQAEQAQPTATGSPTSIGLPIDQGPSLSADPASAIS